VKKGTETLLAKLAQATKLGEALDFVADLEKSHDFTWRAVGDRENNYGSINIGSDPGYAFVERVTNAIDAVIEREALRRLPKQKGKAVPNSPREVVEMWFKVPGGRVSNVKDIKKRQELANEVVIRIFEGSNKRHPTLEVQDYGVGLTPSSVPKTILSLGESNKIDKPYLAGAYGQGGSTALAFSPKGTLIVSFRQPDLLPKGETPLAAVTFARYNELDPNKNKNGRYEYLVGPDNQVAGIDPTLLDQADAGTRVLHFDLDIPQYSARLTQLTGSMWWLLQNALFDPVLPFWAEERRPSMLEKGKELDRRTIAGNFTRLSDDKKDKVEHQGNVDVLMHHPTGETHVRVNYWVVKQPEESGSSQPIESYVDPFRPIAYTFYGQTHGSDDRRFIADRLALPYLAKFLIIQVELDHLTPQARRELMSSTRDRLKQCSFFDQMRESICSALSEDEDLIRLNEQRREKILARHSESEAQKMRERFARLMERFKAGIDVKAKGKGGTQTGRREKPSGPRIPLKPLPTKDEPTFIKIANTQKPVVVRLDRHALLRLESDAPDGYLSSHVHAKLTLACQPEGLLTLESRSDFLGGRSRMLIRPTEKAKSGDTGSATVFLFTPSEKTFSSIVTFKLDKPEEQQTSGTSGKAKIQVPDPIPVHKDEWADFDWDETDVSEVKEDEKGTKIFVNMDNRHLIKLLQGGGYQETGVKRMQNAFLLYVAFYSWARHAALVGEEIGLEGKEFEEYQASELDRVAQTVVHSISAAGRLEEED
jgi:hypothetical protein